MICISYRPVNTVIEAFASSNVDESVLVGPLTAEKLGCLGDELVVVPLSSIIRTDDMVGRSFT
jgi:hypothetical protein